MNWIWITLVLLEALKGNPKAGKAVQDLRMKEFNEDEDMYILLKIRYCFQNGNGKGGCSM